MSRDCSVVDTARCESPPGHTGPGGWLIRCEACGLLVCLQCSLRIPGRDGVEAGRYCHQCLRHLRDDLGYRPLVVARVEALLGLPVRDDLAATLATMGVLVPEELRVRG